MSEYGNLETLSAFWDRTNSFIWDSLPHGGDFVTNPNLGMKVDASGALKPYFGNTVVFTLPKDVQKKIEIIRDRLYRDSAELLAEPLSTDSFHITLHDLLSGNPANELTQRVESIRASAIEYVEQIKARNETVRLHSTALFNMVGSSLVLGFAPADEESCRKLMEYYAVLQNVVHLNYPLTPHVTVAYYRPGVFRAEQTDKLQAVINEVREAERIEAELPVAALEYQLFSDMNHYWEAV